jgi:predicted SAM-dependent methyltransferase
MIKIYNVEKQTSNYNEDNDGKRVVELGAGNESDPRSDIRIDIADLDYIDIVHDISETPWPIEKDSVDGVIATHLFEHIDNLGAVFEECQRILKDGGWIEGTVPIGCGYLSDPTHKTEWNWDTPEYFTKEHNLSYYYNLDFELVDRYHKVWLRGPAKILNILFIGVVRLTERMGDAAWVSMQPYVDGELTFKLVLDNSD